MARPLSTAVSVDDLVHVTEYLVRLAYAPLRRALSSEPGKATIGAKRETVLKVALKIEQLEEPWEKNHCCDVDRCCADLQGVIEKTLSPDAIRKMRTAVRQMRLHEVKALERFSLASTYARWAEADGQKSLDL